MSSFESNITTYFVETHEYNFETGNCDLLEYYKYESTHFQGPKSIESPTHDTILSLQVF